jgi:hypothetical protein
MRFERLAPALILAVLAAPAVAAPPDVYSLVAAITGGLSDGGQVSLGELGSGKVARTGPKGYVVNLPSGQASFLFAQPQPCVFTETSQIKGRPPLTVQFNFAQVQAVAFADQGQSAGLNAIALEFQGTGDLVQIVADDGTAQSAQPAASIVTSLTVDQLNKAAAALHAICAAQ